MIKSKSMLLLLLLIKMHYLAYGTFPLRMCKIQEMESQELHY